MGAPLFFGGETYFRYDRLTAMTAIRATGPALQQITVDSSGQHYCPVTGRVQDHDRMVC